MLDLSRDRFLLKKTKILHHFAKPFFTNLRLSL